MQIAENDKKVLVEIVSCLDTFAEARHFTSFDIVGHATYQDSVRLVLESIAQSGVSILQEGKSFLTAIRNAKAMHWAILGDSAFISAVLEYLDAARAALADN